MTTSKHPETLVLHGGYRADPATGAVAVPIYQTTSYQFRDTEHAANLFALKELGNIYTRIMNPTSDVLEKRDRRAGRRRRRRWRVARARRPRPLRSRTSRQAGDNIVSSTDLYGGTWNLFANTLQGPWASRCASSIRPIRRHFRRATDDRTRAYYAETLPNPKLTVFPIAEVAAIGRELGVPLIMDNTAAPMLCRPLEHGAAIVVHSTTKYIGGHGTSIGGMHRRRRQFRLGSACRALPDAEHARSQLSRRGLDRGGEAAGPDRLHHQGARHAAARPRRAR